MGSNIYKYNLSETAETDIDEAIDYIIFKLKNPDAVKSLFDEIIRKIQDICNIPGIGHIVKNEFEQRNDVRWLPVHNYIIYYVINDSDQMINIVRFVSARRDKHLIISSIIEG